MEAEPTKGLKNRTRTSITLEPVLLAKLRQNTIKLSTLVGRLLTEYSIEKNILTEEEALPLCKTYGVNYEEFRTKD